MSAKPKLESPLAASNAPLRPISFGDPAVNIERRDDGTIYLRPKMPLREYPHRLTDRLQHWAKAEPGQIYATADVLDRCNTLFETTRLEPFAVKGKAEPVQALSVGRAQGSRTRQGSLQRQRSRLT